MPDSLSPSDERQLVRSAQQLNEEALSALFNLYYPKIFRFGMSHLGNVHAAEDLASDVMLKMLESIHTYRFKGPPFSAWVFRIARNRLIDVLRRRRGPRSREVGLNESLVSPQIAPDIIIERVMEQREIWQALQQLNDRQARVIVLRFIHELDTATVGAIVGCSPGSVKSLQHRALKSLRRVISPEVSTFVRVPAAEMA